MIRRRLVGLLAVAIFLLCLTTRDFSDRQASFAAQPVPAGQDDKDGLAGQIKELQKLIADLQSQVGDVKTPRIVAAGTATVRIGPRQNNKNSVRVKLRDDIVASLGDNYIIELTNRYPTSYDFFVAYWRKAPDGFDIFLADPSLVGEGINPKPGEPPFFVDWIVVRK